jgi:hypothetical protein
MLGRLKGESVKIYMHIYVFFFVVVVENTTNLDERLAKGPTSAHHIHGGI